MVCVCVNIIIVAYCYTVVTQLPVVNILYQRVKIIFISLILIVLNNIPPAILKCQCTKITLWCKISPNKVQQFIPLYFPLYNNKKKIFYIYIYII